mgnify:CR=1 FL=1
MRDGGKGDTPRPLGVPMDQFDNNWDAIFKKKNETPAVEKPDCYCYNCNKDYTEPGQYIPYVATRMILCPECGNKRCPHATDHNNPCTDSNEPGQPGSRY